MTTPNTERASQVVNGMDLQPLEPVQPLQEAETLEKPIMDATPISSDAVLPVGEMGHSPTQANRANQDVYSETVSSNLNKVSPTAAMENKMMNLRDKTPEQRAQIGKVLGGSIGLKNGNIASSIIGAGIGARMTRAAGQIQSGEHEDNVRKTRMNDALSSVGVLNNKTAMDVQNPDLRLPNVSAVVSGKKDRTVYDIDNSNPFTNRSIGIVAPLANYFSKGVMGWNKSDNPRDVVALNNATSMFTNMVQQDADNIRTVYKKAKELYKKAGVSKKAMTQYLETIKPSLSEAELTAFNKTMGIIYG